MELKKTQSDDYEELLKAIFHLQDAVQLLADLEIETIELRGPASCVDRFTRVIKQETKAIDREFKPHHLMRKGELCKLLGVTLIVQSPAKAPSPSR